MREIIGFEVGDIVTEKARRYYAPKMWEVVGVDLRLRMITIQRGIQGPKFVQLTVSNRKLILIRTAEERVMDAVMQEEG